MGAKEHLGFSQSNCFGTASFQRRFFMSASVLSDLITKPIAKATKCSSSLREQMSEWNRLFEKWIELKCRMAVSLASEQSALKTAVDVAWEELKTLKKKFSGPEDFQAVLRAEYHRLNKIFLEQRDEAYMPYLFPINVSQGEETIWAKFLVRNSQEPGSKKESSERLDLDLCLPGKWPSLLQRCYSDMARGLLTEEVLIKAESYRDSFVSRFTVKFDSVIPAEARRKILRAMALVGDRNVYLVVDCTGVKPMVEHRILPEVDPVAIAVVGNELFHIVDFDTTAAEAHLALS